MKGILTMICYFLRIQLTLSKKHELLFLLQNILHNITLTKA